MSRTVSVTVSALFFIVCGFSLCITFVRAASGTSVTQDCYSGDEFKSRRCYQLSDASAAHNILQYFYRSNLAYNYSQLGWSTKTHPCDGQIMLEFGNNSIYNQSLTTWVGVTCAAIIVALNRSSDQFFVTAWKIEEIEMRELQGELPDAFGTLTNLQQLSVRQIPKLSGPIPISIMKLPHLEKLTLSGNNHSGSFPIGGDLPNLLYLDISNNSFSGILPLDGLDYAKLQHLDLSQNKFSGFSMNWCTYIYPSYDQLVYLNLSNNHFRGTFCTSVFKAALDIDISKNRIEEIQNINSTFNDFLNDAKNLHYGIQTIYAQHNLIATFPTNIVQLPSLLNIYLGNNHMEGLLILPFIYSGNSTRLNVISLVNNKITDLQTSEQDGSLFQETSLKNLQVYLLLGGNPICNNFENHKLEDLLRYLCRFDKSDLILPPKNLSVDGKRSNTILIVATTTSSGILLIFFSIILAIVMKKLMKQTTLLREIEKEFAKRDVKPNLYEYSELKMATQDFHEKNKLGAGGFGVVYKGTLQDGSMLAIKRLIIKTDQALEDFFNEIVSVSSIKHRNLVQLKGCCVKGEDRFLVYELVDNKNLAEALWDRPMHEDSQLNWQLRLNIIIGVARGLSYLHEDVQPAIIHHDIKPPNILLDKNFNPKIADFGLALLYPEFDDDRTHQSVSKIAGTRGYISPEYAAMGQVSTKLDVYSFGILILEIISGRKNIDVNLPVEQHYLFDWARNLHEEGDLFNLIDTSILSSTFFEVETIIKVINVGLLCIHYLPANRPSMSEVIDMILGNRNIECELSSRNQYDKTMLLSFFDIGEEESVLLNAQSSQMVRGTMSR